MIELITQLKEKLIKPLPGMEAQYEMAPITRGKFDVTQTDLSTFKRSAVMLLLYKQHHKLFIPLIKRHIYAGMHSGQISLPGGKFDESDITLENTALRELNEEIGVNQDIEILGKLTPLIIPVSNFYVEPYIGICTSENLHFTMDKREVKELICLDVNLLKSDLIMQKEGIVEGDGYKLKTPYFNVEGEIIWGATAMILNEFKKLLI